MFESHESHLLATLMWKADGRGQGTNWEREEDLLLDQHSCLICVQFGKYPDGGEQIPVFCRLENHKMEDKNRLYR